MLPRDIIYNEIARYIDYSDFLNFILAVKLPKNIIKINKKRFMEKVVTDHEKYYILIGYGIHGTHIQYSNGVGTEVKVQTTYVRGVKEGPRIFRNFLFNGVIDKYTYVNDMRHGPYKSRYENGQLRRNGYYINDKKDGLWEHYYINGNLSKQVEYSNGEKSGLWKKWFDNGNLHIQATYKDDKRDGLWQRWFDDGNLLEQHNWVDGKMHGLYQTYYRNGNIHEQVNYVDYHRHGLYQSWFYDGSAYEEIHYSNGVRN